MQDQAMTDWVQHAEDIAIEQPAPHGGNGLTIAAPFFEKVPGMELVVRQRTLPRGGSIGSHLHDKDEVYYVASGRGVYTLDGETYDVAAGSALLVRPGSTHAIAQKGDAPLVIVIIQKVAAKS
jgi:quercetin dioxygenase-like cupin family protein